MEKTQLWSDYNTNKHFLIVEEKGIQKQCDNHGNELKRWKPYGTGFMSFRDRINISEQSGDKTGIPFIPKYSSGRLYTPAMKKFDGYSQFPRPKSQALCNKTLIAASQKPVYLSKLKGKVQDLKSVLPESRMPDDIKSIPRPMTNLTFAACHDSTVKLPKSKKQEQDEKRLLQERLDEKLALTKTARQMFQGVQFEQKLIESFRPPPEKQERVMTKGRFMCTYNTSGDHYLKDRDLLKQTNPKVYESQLKYWELDRKILEKRRQQRVLKNRITMGEDKPN